MHTKLQRHKVGKRLKTIDSIRNPETAYVHLPPRLCDKQIGAHDHAPLSERLF
jgi:hypothetical protein